MRPFTVCLTMLALSLAACTGEPEAADTAGAGTRPADGVTPDGPRAPEDRGVAGARLDYDGFGPVRIGMTVAELRAKLDEPLPRGDSLDPRCDYLTATRLPDRMHLMFENQRLVRIDVANPDVQTAAGARIGDSEARIDSLYGDVSVSGHKYIDGHYLSVHAPGDTMRRIVFETDKDTVLRFRAGVMPNVRWVEGCS